METLTVSDPRLDTKIQTLVENEYFHRYFVSQSDVEEEIVTYLRGNGVVTAPSVQSATIDSYAAFTDDNPSRGDEDEPLNYDEF